MGPRQREPASLLFRRLENAWLRNRRTARMDTARQRCRAHGRRLVDYQNREGIPRIGYPGLGRSQARKILRRASDRLLAHFRWCEARSLALRAAEAQHHRALARY